MDLSIQSIRKSQATRRGLRPRLVSLAVAGALSAWGGASSANPTGASITVGNATITANGQTLTIANTPGAVINWQQFSIRKDEITRFLQQNASSAVLNRVIGQDPSVILGKLLSNGRVFLVNPSGIVIGKGAVIDVAGFAASSLNISDADWVSGKLNFKGTGLEGKVENAGTIKTVEGGHVYLIAPKVENKPDGVIQSPQGEVIIAAGKTVELVNAGTPNIRVEFTAPDNEAVNAGQVVAEGGRIGIYGTLIKNSGRVSASRAVVGKGGKILFKATKDVQLDPGSTVEANGTTGGDITIQADTGTILAQGRIEANGIEAGGTITLAAAKGIDIPAGALVSAKGTGGKVELAATSPDATPTSVRIGGRVEAGASVQIKAPKAKTEIAAEAIIVAPEIKVTSAIFAGEGALDASGARGGRIDIEVDTVDWAGSLLAVGAAGDGGVVRVQAADSITTMASSIIRVDGAQAGGEVSLQAVKTEALISGTVSARGLTTGGEITLTAPQVETHGAVLDASGAFGGGRVRVGGDYQGGGDVPQAKHTYVDLYTRIRADAEVEGEGGTVIVWSTDATIFAGEISARGGARAGNGGFVETSGGWLDVGGTVDTRAPAGMTGTWLLDPKFIVVAASGGSALNPGTNNLFANNTGGTSTITPTSINSASSNVILQANTDITFTDAVSITGAGISLTAQAGRSILVNANITTNNASITLTANENSAAGGVAADRSVGSAAITMAAGTSLVSGGGDITIAMNPGTGVANSKTGNISLRTVNAGSGNVTVTHTGVTGGGTGNITLNSPITAGSLVYVSAAGGNITSAGSFVTGAPVTAAVPYPTDATVVLQASGKITISGTVNLTTAGAGFVAQAGDDVNVDATVTTTGGKIHLGADSPHAGTAFDGAGRVNVSAAVSSTGGNITLVGGGNSSPDGGFKLDADVNAGSGGINVALSQTSGALPFYIGAGGNTQLSSSDTGALKTAGALVLGTAKTAGTDGLGTGALTLTVDSITNSNASPITLSADSGSSFELVAGSGGIVLSRALTTFQDTVISTTGPLIVNQPVDTSSNDLSITASSITLGPSGSFTTGTCSTGNCTGVASVYWDGGASNSDWFSSLNWSDDTVPDATTDVTIPTGYIVVIGTGAGAAAKTLIAESSLTISSGSLTLAEISEFHNTLTVSGGSLLGAGSVLITGTAGSLIWSGGTLDNGGGEFTLLGGHSGTLSGNSLTLNRGFHNNGMLTLNAATIDGTTGSITNVGTITALASTSNTINVSLANTGTVSALGSLAASNFPTNDGILSIGGSGVFSTGNVSLANTVGSSIQVASGGSFNLGSGTLTNSGTATIDGAATVGALTLSAGTVGGTGDLTVSTDYNAAGGTLGTTFSDLVLHKVGNFTTGAAGFTAVDSLGLFATGDLTLNGAVSAGGKVTLSSTGSVTQTVAIAANALELLGSGGSYVLTNTGNNVATLAADTGSVSYTDTNALSVGSVNATTGISATGLVDIRTQSGDLTLTNAIGTTSTSASAVTLVADAAATPDATGTGGNFKNAGSVSITTGAGGAWRIYSGNPTGTTRGGLVEAGKRYNVDDGSDPIASGNRIYFRIQPTLTLTADGKSKTYGDANPTFTFGSLGLIDGDLIGAAISTGPTFTVDGSTSTSGQLTAGTAHNITPGSATSGLGYSFSYTSGSLTVNKLALTGSVGAASSTYGSALTPGAANLTNVVGTDVVNATIAVDTTGLLSTSGNLIAGTHTGIENVSALGGADAGNYTFAGVVGDYTVNKLALTGSVGAASSTYGSALTPGAANLTNVVGTDVVNATIAVDTTGLLSTSGNLIAGTHTGIENVSALGGADAGNYTFAGVVGDYTVNKLALTGSVGAASSTYGSALTPGAANLTNVVGTDVVNATIAVDTTGLLSTSGNLIAGTHTGIENVSALGGADAGNYTFAGVVGDYTVNKLALTGSVGAASSTYGSALTPGAANLTNVVGTDVVNATIAVDTTGLLSTSGNLIAGTHTGIENVSALGGADAGNYTFAGVVGDYTVNKLALTGSVGAASSTYGSALTPGAANLTNVVGTDVVNATIAVDTTGLLSTSGNLIAGTHTGIENVSALGGADAGNYTFAGVVGDYTVNKLALTGSVGAASSTYGSALTPGAANLTNVVGTDVVNATIAVDTTGLLSTSGNLIAGTHTGIENVSALGGADAGNYTFAGVVGDYTVNKLALTGSVGAASSTYGSALTPGAANLTNVVGTDVVNATIAVDTTGLLSTSGNLIAGTHTGIENVSALGGADAGNYTFAGVVGDYTVNKLALTGSVGAASSTYGSALTPGAANLTNVVGTDVVNATIAVDTTGLLSTSGNLIAGTHTGIENVSALGGADAGNYTFAGVVGDYTVNKLALTGSVGAASSTYGSALTPGAANLTNVVGTDVVNATIAVDTTGLLSTSGNLIAGTHTGIENVSALGGADAGNYTFAGVVGDYTVNKLALTGSVGAASSTYGSALTPGAANLTNVVGTDVVNATIAVDTTGLLSTSGNLIAGTHTGIENVSALGGADAGNYTFAGVVGDYTVNKLALTGSVGAASSTYGSALTPGAANLTNVVGTDVVNATIAVDTTGLLSTSGNLIAGTHTGIENVSALGGADAGNYTFAGVVGDYTVNKLALTGSVGAASSTYGSALTPGAANLTNVVGTDVVNATIAVDTTGLLSTSGNLIAGTHTGIENVSALGGADAGNYTFAGVVGDYTVNKLALTGSVGAASSTYGSALTPGAANLTNVVGTDVVNATIAVDTTGLLSTSGNLIAGTHTGIENVSALGGADAGNYTFAGVVGDYTVNKLALTGSVGAASSTYGSALTPGAANLTNVVGTDVVNATIAVDTTGLLSTSGNLIAGTHTGIENVSALGGADAGNYTFAGVVGDYTVNKLALTGSVGAASSTYGSALTPGAANLTNVVGTDVVNATIAVDTTGLLSTSGNLIAGTHTGIENVSALGGADAGNYTFAGVVGDYTVNKLALTGSVGAASSTYGSALTPGAANLTNVVGTDVVNATIAVDTTGLLSTSGNLIAGTHTGIENVSALGGADAGNYTFAGVVGDYTVNKLALTGSVGAASSTYGSALTPGAANLTNVVGTDVVNATIAVDTTGLLSTSGNLIAGTHTGIENVSALGGADAGNYTFAGVVGDYTVNKLALTGSVGAASSTYGSALTPGAANLTNVVGTDVVNATIAVDTTGLLSTSGNLIAGTHTGIENVSALGGADAGNYTFAGVVGDYTVNKLALTGSVGAASSTYGSALTPGAANLTNVVGTDVVNATIAVDTTGLLSTSGNLIAGTHTGIENVSALGGADAGNYTFAGVVGDYTVNKLALTGSVGAASSTYGSALTPGAANLTNVVGTDVVNATIAVDTTGLLSTSGNLIAGTHTGIENVSALGGADAGNYTFAGVVGDYTVNKLALTGSVGAASSTYGSALTPGAANLTNVVGTDVVNATIAVDTTGLLSTSGNLIAGTHTGIENVSALGGADAGNYTFAGVVGDYTVNKLALTGSVGAASSTYGSALTPGAANLTNVVGTDVVNATIAVDTTGLLSTSGNLIAGTHTGIENVSALGGADAGNYTFAGVVGDYTVNKLALTGSVGAASSTYGSALTPGAANLTNVVGTDVVNATIAVDTTGLLSTSGNLIAGTHTGIENVSALGGADAGNYTFAGVVGDYTVDPATLTFLANAASRERGDPNPSFSGSVTGFVPGESLASATTGGLSFTSPALQTSPEGAYAINGSGLTANNGNYTFIQAPGNSTALTITPPVNFTWTSAGSGDWGTSTNWNKGFAPVSGAIVTIPDLAGTQMISYAAGTTTIKSLTSYEGLNLTGGTLNLGSTAGDVSTIQPGALLSLNGGTLGGVGTLNASQVNIANGLLSYTGNVNFGAFSQSAGMVSVTGNVGVTNGFSQTGGSLAATNTLTLAGPSVLVQGTTSGGALSVNTPGNVTISAGGTAASLTSATNANLQIDGDLVVQGGSASGASATLLNGPGTLSALVGNNVVITGGSGADAYALVQGNPDIGSLANPASIGGELMITTGTGAGAYARLESTSAHTVYLFFPNLAPSDYGYEVDGVLGRIANGQSGIFAGGLPAMLGTIGPSGSIGVGQPALPPGANLVTIYGVVGNLPALAQDVKTTQDEVIFRTDQITFLASGFDPNSVEGLVALVDKDGQISWMAPADVDGDGLSDSKIVVTCR